MEVGGEGSQPWRTMRRVRIALAATLLLGAPALYANDEAHVLAPSGHLRVGVYMGSPTSMVTDSANQTHGVTYELGKDLAERLHVPVDYVSFSRIAEVVEAIKDGKVDFTVTNATAVRAKDVDFSQTLLAVELGYLVPANSPIRTAKELERPGVRIGVTKGGTSERVLSELLKTATIISEDSVARGIEAMRKAELDVYATNKAILFQMSEQLPGARVLDGNWGQEHMAIAVPKGRDSAKAFLNDFVRDVQAHGRLEQVEAQAGLKGAVKPRD
jgi:polar amino acid transport system substrate-binding protein